MVGPTSQPSFCCQPCFLSFSYRFSLQGHVLINTLQHQTPLGVCLPRSPTCDIEQAGDRDPETEKATGAVRSTGSRAEGAHSQWPEEEGRWQRVLTVLPGAAAEQLTAKPVPPAVSHSQPSAASQLLSQFCRGSVRSQGCTPLCVGQELPVLPQWLYFLIPSKRTCAGQRV